MRQSMATSRASQVSSAAHGSSSAAALSKLAEKKKEYEAVSALERASALYLERLDALGDDCNIMADAGEIHGQVLAQWPKMFQILAQFLSSRDNSDMEVEGRSKAITVGQRLIRIPIEELQEIKTERS